LKPTHCVFCRDFLVVSFDADFSEAKKRITVDLAQQQIRREGCEAGDAGDAGALTTDLHYVTMQLFGGNPI